MSTESPSPVPASFVEGRRKTISALRGASTSVAIRVLAEAWVGLFGPITDRAWFPRMGRLVNSYGPVVVGRAMYAAAGHDPDVPLSYIAAAARRMFVEEQVPMDPPPVEDLEVQLARARGQS